MRDALQPEIQSDRLILRAWRHSDAEALFALFNNWEVVRWLSWPPWPYVIDDARSYIAGAIQQQGCSTSAGQPLAACAGPNFGYWIGQPYWGRGYMTEAVRALARAVFGRGPHDAIFSGAFTDNVASLRVQEKAGFVRDGDTMLHARPRGATFPTLTRCSPGPASKAFPHDGSLSVLPARGAGRETLMLAPRFSGAGCFVKSAAVAPRIAAISILQRKRFGPPMAGAGQTRPCRLHSRCGRFTPERDPTAINRRSGSGHNRLNATQP
jgi:RimJ/RimL family protein N-acetyltransferase